MQWLMKSFVPATCLLFLGVVIGALNLRKEITVSFTLLNLIVIALVLLSVLWLIDTVVKYYKKKK